MKKLFLSLISLSITSFSYANPDFALYLNFQNNTPYTLQVTSAQASHISNWGRSLNKAIIYPHNYLGLYKLQAKYNSASCYDYLSNTYCKVLSDEYGMIQFDVYNWAHQPVDSLIIRTSINNNTEYPRLSVTSHISNYLEASLNPDAHNINLMNCVFNQHSGGVNSTQDNNSAGSSQPGYYTCSSTNHLFTIYINEKN